MERDEEIMSPKILEFSSQHIASDREDRLKTAIGLYARKRYAAALPMFVKLIDDDCKEAYAYAASIYETGGDGVDQDFERAFFYYQKSIENFGNVGTHLALGRFYYYGWGTKQDYAKAYEYYSWVDQEKDHPLAHLMLGRLYHKGHGVKQDLDKAREYYEKAITKGYVFGLTYLGFLEQECGHYLKGWRLRLKAAYLSLKIGARDPRDSRLRNC